MSKAKTPVQSPSGGWAPRSRSLTSVGVVPFTVTRGCSAFRRFTLCLVLRDSVFEKRWSRCRPRLADGRSVPVVVRNRQALSVN